MDPDSITSHQPMLPKIFIMESNGPNLLPDIRRPISMACLMVFSSFSRTDREGTYLVNRFLVIFPKVVDLVVLDGICSTTSCREDTYDRDLDTVGKEFLDYCGNDAFCIQKLGLDPVQTLSSLIDQVSKGL
jgi:hypothetical protein